MPLNPGPCVSYVHEHCWETAAEMLQHNTVDTAMDTAMDKAVRFLRSSVFEVYHQTEGTLFAFDNQSLDGEIKKALARFVIEKLPPTTQTDAVRMSRDPYCTLEEGLHDATQYLQKNLSENLNSCTIPKDSIQCVLRDVGTQMAAQETEDILQEIKDALHSSIAPTVLCKWKITREAVLYIVSRCKYTGRDSLKDANEQLLEYINKQMKSDHALHRINCKIREALVTAMDKFLHKHPQLGGRSSFQSHPNKYTPRVRFDLMCFPRHEYWVFWAATYLTSVFGVPYRKQQVAMQKAECAHLKEKEEEEEEEEEEDAIHESKRQKV